MQTTQKKSFSKYLTIFMLAASSLLVTGCMDPAAMMLVNSMFPQKKDNKKEPKLICSNGVVSLEENGQGIVGGKILDKDSWLARGVVFIVQEFEHKGEMMMSRCTGSLIDDNIVLTAAHCVSETRYSYRDNLKIYFTNQPECDQVSGKITSLSGDVDGLRIHEKWEATADTTDDDGDVALIRLKEKAPSGFYPLKLAKEFVKMTSDKKILMAGYGKTNVDYSGSYSTENEGVLLRMGQTTAITAKQKSDLLGWIREGNRKKGKATSEREEKALDNAADNEYLVIDQTQGIGVCAGDSGGPSLMKNDKGMYVITGVASLVANPYDNSRGCGYIGMHANVQYYKTWLENSYKALKNSKSTKSSLFE